MAKLKICSEKQPKPSEKDEFRLRRTSFSEIWDKTRGFVRVPVPGLQSESLLFEKEIRFMGPWCTFLQSTDLFRAKLTPLLPTVNNSDYEFISGHWRESLWPQPSTFNYFGQSPLKSGIFRENVENCSETLSKTTGNAWFPLKSPGFPLKMLLFSEDLADTVSTVTKALASEPLFRENFDWSVLFRLIIRQRVDSHSFSNPFQSLGLSQAPLSEEKSLKNAIFWCFSEEIAKNALKTSEKTPKTPTFLWELLRFWCLELDHHTFWTQNLPLVHETALSMNFASEACVLWTILRQNYVIFTRIPWKPLRNPLSLWQPVHFQSLRNRSWEDRSKLPLFQRNFWFFQRISWQGVDFPRQTSEKP